VARHRAGVAKAMVISPDGSRLFVTGITGVYLATDFGTIGSS